MQELIQHFNSFSLHLKGYLLRGKKLKNNSFIYPNFNSIAQLKFV